MTAGGDLRWRSSSSARRTSRRTRRPHAQGIKQGNSRGNYEKQDGHLPDGRATARSSTGINAGQARADRPADAEPPAGLGRWPPRSPLAGAVPELAFAVLDAARRRATPRRRRSRFSLRIDEPGRAADPVGAARHAAADRGAPARATTRRRTSGSSSCSGHVKDWGTTLRTLLWTRTTLVVPPFTGSTVVELHVPCTYDIEVLASRYLDALADGEVPLEFLFSGTVFYAGAGGQLQAARISWEQDAEYRLPVRVWRETMDHHFPRHRVAAAAQATASTGCAPTRRATRSRAGRTPSTRCCGGGLSRGPRPRDRRRRALRGLPAVALPPLGDQEPAPLDVRRRVPARARRAPPGRPRGGCAPSACSRAARTRRVDVPCASCTSSRAQVLRDGEPVDELRGRRRAPPVVGRGGRARGDARRARAARRSRSRPGARRSRCRAARSCARGRRSTGAVERARRAGRRRARADRASRSPTRRRGTATTARTALRRTFCSTHTVLRTRGGRVRLADRPARAAARRRGARAATRACGRCSSTSATRCSPRRSSSRTTRGSRPRAPATCSTAARSTSCSCSTSSASPTRRRPRCATPTRARGRSSSAPRRSRRSS